MIVNSCTKVIFRKIIIKYLHFLCLVHFTRDFLCYLSRECKSAKVFVFITKKKVINVMYTYICKNS